MFYLAKTPWWLKRLYPDFTWDIKTRERVIYLSFDDGPHERATPFVLDSLREYAALATFFCVGKNVVAHPELYRRIIEEGHAVGNHTQHHLNGWKTPDQEYLDDVSEAARHIESSLFRPPHGWIRRSQGRLVPERLTGGYGNIIMWDILSGDFDTSLSPASCLRNVVAHLRPGSIIVFHDSEKAFPRLEYALPRVLEFASAKGYRFEPIVSLEEEKRNPGNVQ